MHCRSPSARLYASSCSSLFAVSYVPQYTRQSCPIPHGEVCIGGEARARACTLLARPAQRVKGHTARAKNMKPCTPQSMPHGNYKRTDICAALRAGNSGFAAPTSSSSSSILPPSPPSDCKACAAALMPVAVATAPSPISVSIATSMLTFVKASAVRENKQPVGAVAQVSERQPAAPASTSNHRNFTKFGCWHTNHQEPSVARHYSHRSLFRLQSIAARCHGQGPTKVC